MPAIQGIAYNLEPENDFLLSGDTTRYTVVNVLEVGGKRRIVYRDAAGRTSEIPQNREVYIIPKFNPEDMPQVPSSGRVGRMPRHITFERHH